MLGREGSAHVRVTERRSIRAGYGILLVAMAIQGITPDHVDLASARLLRLVTHGLAGSRCADTDCAPRHIPIPHDQDDRSPGEIRLTVVTNAAPRTRLDGGTRPSIYRLSPGLPESLARWILYSLQPAEKVQRSPQELILSLCRLTC
jgi:hypothetical protein